MEAGSLANTVLARKPTIENLQRFREVFLDPGRTMVQRIRLLNSTYLFQRKHEAVQRELTTVARLARPPELRQAALRMLSHPAPASVKRELSEWALEEQDARVLSALVDALRMTNTNPGRDLLRLVGRLETPEYGLAVARLAIGMAQIGTDATVDAALQALTDRRYAHSIAALVPRLERKGFLEHATVPILDAMAVVLASGDRADVRLVLRHIATSRLPALKPAVRKISETAKEADVREAAKRAMER